MTHLSLDTRWRALLASVLTSILVVLAGPAVLAQQDEAAAPEATIKAVDVRGDPTLWVHTAQSSAPEASVVVNGTPARSDVAPVWTSGYRLDTVLVIDSSESNQDSLQALKDAARSYVTDLAPGERVALVTSGAAGRLLMPFTANSERLASEIDSIGARGPSRLWDGVATGIAELESSAGAEVVSSMVIFAAGADELSDSRLSVIQGRLTSLNALVHVTGVSLRGLDTDTLNSLVAQNGGSVSIVGTNEELAAATADLPARVQGVWAVSFTSDQIDAGRNLDVTIDGQQFSVAYVPDSVVTGGALDRGVPIGSGNPISFLTGNRALLIGIALGAVAVGMAVLAVGLLFQTDESALSSMLSAYQEGGAEDGAEHHSLTNNAIFQKAVELTEQIAEKQGFLGRTEEKLERANLPFKAAEALTFYAASVVVSLLLAFLLRGDLRLAIALPLLGIVMPVVVVNFMGVRRRKKFVSQLPDTLTLLAGTLKAGYSFMQGLESVSKETEDPMGEELRKVVTEAQLGRPVEEALDMSAERMDSDDYAWAIMAVKIQREVGGNLSELLMTVAETMTARERLRRDVAALTAEGRISAIVLGFLPVGLGAVMYVINPGYVGLLFSETAGNVMLITGVISALIGFAWMKKLITIEI